MRPSQQMMIMFLFATVWCIGMVFFRMLTTGTSTYNFMVLNLFLAWTPLLFSTALVEAKQHHRINKQPIIIILLALLWIFFLPNAPYLLTDFIHLKIRDQMPLWYDILLLESFTLVGLMLGTISTMQIERLLKIRWGKTGSMYISIGIFFLVSCGVALGRFFRFNSWEIVTSPGTLFRQLLISFYTPDIWIESIAFSVFFFFFLTGVHFLIKTIDEWQK